MIKELLKDFEELQIREIVKQVNTNTRATTGSAGSNFFNPNNYEGGKPSNPARDYETPLRRPYNKNYRGLHPRRRKSAITEEFQPKNPIIQETIPPWGQFLNIDHVIDIRKSLNTWKAGITLALISEPVYATKD